MLVSHWCNIIETTEITPHAPNMDASDFHKGQYAIQQGRKSVEKIIDHIKDTLKKATESHRSQERV